MARIFDRLTSLTRRVAALFASPPSQVDVDEAHSAKLRRLGVTVGGGCRIYTTFFSTEPWLVRIGNRVGIAGGVKFLTHDGSACLIRTSRPHAQSLGTIEVGDDVFIGENAIILPGAVIGSGSIIGPGSVVRGVIPDNSLVVGNPGEIVGRASLHLERMKLHRNTLDVYGLDELERRERILAHFTTTP